MATIVVLAVVLLLHGAGSLSWTWDESRDMAIVRCVETTHAPFACLDDISQTRLPHYLHTAVAAVTPSIRAHYVLSATFALVNLGLIYAFARGRFGARTALLALVLAATAPSLLASGRMLLSHSNVIFTTFSLSALLAFERFARRGDRRMFWCSAVAFGLAVASSALGVFNAIAVAGLWLFAPRTTKRAWHPIAYGVVAVAVFFATTLIYLRPENLDDLLRATLTVTDTSYYPLWNYLELGSALAPRWFSGLLFGIRVGPWWALLFLLAPVALFRTAEQRRHRRTLLVLWATTAGLLFVKAAVFRYDTPHQQAPWYPLVFVFIAAAVVSLVEQARRARLPLLAVLLLLGGLQLNDVGRFFPNYLFYGAQYGQRYIGEFYGPAVLHKQGRATMDAAIDDLVASDPTALILVADNNGFEEEGPQFVPYTKRDPSATYRYALVDRVYATHMAFPERDEYNALLASRYVVRCSLDYPLDEWAYRIYELAPAAQIAHGDGGRMHWPRLTNPCRSLTRPVITE